MIRAALFSLSLITALVAPAYAQGMNATQVVEVAVTNVDANGNESVSYETAVEVSPGDEVRYSLEYANEGGELAENVELVMPVPTELTLIEDSIMAATAIVTYSSDNGDTFAEREALTVSDGEVSRVAGSEDVTHIKWVFANGIAPAESGTVSFRGILQ